MTAVPAPVSIQLTPDGLAVQWPDGHGVIAATALRAACRCAPCLSARLRGTGVAPQAATLVDVVPVGHYAVQLRFGDGHDRGIYPWSLLHALGASPAAPVQASS